MKLSTVLPAAAGLVAGYVLGAAAGRGRYRQIRTAATTAAHKVVHHPRVEQLLFDLADRASSSAPRMPGPAGDLVDTAATHLQDTLTEPDHDVTVSPAPGDSTPAADPRS